MGSVTTEYNVMLKYMMENRSVVASTQAMTRELRTAEVAAGGLGSTLGRVGAAVMGYLGFSEMKKHLVDFNSEMEQAKLTTAGFMAMSGLGTFNEDLGQADALVKQYTIDARSSIATTADFVEMSKNLTASVTRAGGSVSDLHDMTKGMVIASKAMHMDPNFAAMETEEALMGVLTVRNRFAKKLLQSIGYGGEEGRHKYVTLSDAERMKEFKRALEQPWLKDLARAQEHSFEGARTTFIDNAQLAAMRAGKALFEAIKVELNKWNEYLIKNSATIDHIADVVGHKLVQAAVSFKNAIQFAAEHWKSILATWGMLKGAGYLASAASAAGIAGGAGAGALGSGGKIAAVSIVASAVYIGATELAQWIDRRQSEQINRGATVGRATSDLYLASITDAEKARAFKQMMISSGLATGQGLNRGAFAEAVNADQFQRIRWANALGMANPHEATPEAIAERMAEKFAGILHDEMVSGQLSMGTGFPRLPFLNDAAPLPKPEKPKINVTIQRIEVASDDPDRWAMGFTDWVRNVGRNPSAAMHAIPEAG